MFNLPFLVNCPKPRLHSTRPQIIMNYLGEDIFQNLENVYYNLCGAIKDQDLDFIQSVTHQDIYTRIKKEIELVNNNKLNINFSSNSQSQAKDGKLYEVNQRDVNARYWGSSDTQLAVTTTAFIGLSMATREQHKVKKNSSFSWSRTYFVDPTDWAKSIKQLRDDQIITLFVDILSKTKLYLTNSENALVQGSSDDNDQVRSIIRFQSDSENLDYKMTDINYMVYSGQRFEREKTQGI